MSSNARKGSPPRSSSKGVTVFGSAKARVFVFLTLMILTAVFSASALTANQTAAPETATVQESGFIASSFNNILSFFGLAEAAPAQDGKAARGCDTAPEGLLACYRADNDASDSRGVHNGEWVGTYGYATGKVGAGAFNFSGRGTVEVADAADLNPSNITVDGWVNLASTDGDFTLVSKGDAYSLRVRGGQVVFASRNADGNLETLEGRGTIGTGKWIHIAATNDGAFSRLYIDGEEAGSIASKGLIKSAGSNVVIGSIASNENGFSASADEVKVFNRALTAKEIGEIAGNRPEAVQDVSIVVNPTTIPETGGSTRITVSRNATNAPAGPVSVTFAQTPGSAATLGACSTAGVDYEFSGANNVVFVNAADLADKTLDINACPDALVEGNELASLTATYVGGGETVTGSPVTFTITDDDALTNTVSGNATEGTNAAPSFAGGAIDFVVNRGAAGLPATPALVVNFTMSGAATSTVGATQDYQLSTPTAGCTLNFAGNPNGTIQFDAGAATQTCIVRATSFNDDFVETDEAVIFTITGTTPASSNPPVAPPAAVQANINNDDRPWVRIAVVGTGTSATPVGGTQFVEEGTPLTLAGGAFTYTITRGLCQAASSADATPTTSCPGGVVAALPAQTITFTQAAGTAPGATPGTDFTATTSLAFNAGQDTNTFTTNPSDDVTVEPDESILTTLTGAAAGCPIGAFIAGTYCVDTENTANGIINDDDETVSVTSAGTPVAENAGTPISYTVTRTIDSAGANSLTGAVDPDADQIVVAFTLAGAATQASCDGSDYTVSAGAGTVGVTFTPGACPASGTVTIAGNDSDGIILVTPVNDNVPENNENVELTLTPVADAGVAGYGLAAANTTAPGLITNDDFQVIVRVAPSQRLEGSDPPALDDGGTLVYTFTRIGQTTSQICANFNVSGSAEATSDYTTSFGTAGVAPCTNLFTPVGGAGPSPGRISIAGGAGNPTTEGGVEANQNTFVVTPTDDSTVEADELVIVQVDNHTGIGPVYSPGNPAQATGQINNDDTEVSVTVAPNAVTEDGATNLTYTFTRTGGCGAALTINTTLSGAGGLANDDFVNPPSLGAVAVTFPAGQCSTQVVIDPVADFTVETDETATFTINPSTGAPNDYTIAAAPGNAATGTITNDDSEVTVAVAGSPANEGNLAPAASAPGTLTYTFTRSGNIAAGLTINYTIGGGTNPATGDDFIGAIVGNNSVGFAPGANTATVVITPVAGNVVENDETVRVTVAAGAGYTPSATPADGVIRNDDNDIVCANQGATSVAEGTPAAAGNTLTFRCTRSTLGAQTGVNLSIPYTLGGDAQLGGVGADYTISPASPLVFTGNGNATQTADIVVTTIPDTTVEPDETVTVTFNSGLDGTNGFYLNPNPTTLTGTITNDDNTVTLVVSQVDPVGAGKTVTENGNQELLYTFTRTSQGAALAAQLDVNFSITGTACAATPCSGPSATVDYDLLGAQSWNPATGAGSTGSVRFAPNVTTVSFTVDPRTDGDVEPDETVIATTTAGPGYVAGATDTGTILNDDTSYTLTFTGLFIRTGTGSVGDPFVFTPTMVEGNPPGETIARYTVTRNGVNSPAGTVSVATIPGSGTAIGGPPNTLCVNNDPATSQDYTNDGQTLSFAAGTDSSQFFDVRVCRDLFFENTETFNSQLSNPVGGFLGTTAPVTATIVDDDNAPLLRIGDVSVNENAGTVTLTVTQNVATNLVTTFNYSTGAVGDTATSNVDYTQVVTASGTIPAGATTATFTIPIIDDNFDEPNETFTVTLNSATNAALTGTIGGFTADPIGVVTITDNEPNTTFSVNNVVQIEGNPSLSDPQVASTSAFNFRITRVGDAQASETVCFRTVNGDIENPAINPNPATGGPNLPGFPNDYTIIANNPPNSCVTFTQGGPSFITVPVIVYGDDLFEFDEYFTLEIVSVGGMANPLDQNNNPRITDRLGLGTIQNDDGVTLYTIAQTTPATNPVPESVGTVTYTISRTQAAVAGTVNVATVQIAPGTLTATGSTAGQSCSTAGVDYVSNSATLSFAIGELTKTFSVTICNDTFDELAEDFRVDLSNPTFGNLGSPSSAITTIADDDAAPIISVSDVSACEVDSGTQAFVFTITRSGNSNLTSEVRLSTVSGTAVSPGDFVAIVAPAPGVATTVPPQPGVVTFGPGETTKTVTVTVNGDTTFETDESFTLQVASASSDLVITSAGGADPVGLGVIQNVCAGGDPAPTFALGPVTQAEGTDPVGTQNPFFVRLTRTGATEVPGTLTFATAAGPTNPASGGATCTGSTDYITQSGTTVNFPAAGFSPTTSGGVFGGAQGANFVDIPIQVCRDAVFEQNETVNATLAAVQFAQVSPTGSPALVTISNDDGLQFRIRFPGPEGAEGAAGTTTNFNFTIDRVGDSSVSSTVCYETVNGTATAGSDYVALPATTCSTFNSGTMSVNVPVVVNGDNVGEADETFFLRLVSSSAVGSTIDAEQRLATINNDDGPIPPPTGVEGDVVDGAGGAAGDGLVQANDVTAIRNAILGTLTLVTTPNQFQRADVNLPCGNGGIDAGDVTVIRNMILGTTPANTPACGPTAPGGPGNIEASRPDVTRVIRAGTQTLSQSPAAQTVTIPFQLDSQGDETSISFTANWNPAVLTYVSSAIGNGVPAGTNFGVNATQTAQGRLGILLDSTNVYLAGTRQIATVTFTVAAGAAAGTYPITFSSTPTVQSVSNAQGALLTTAYEQGNVIIVLTSAGVTVSGRVTTANGQGLRNATVILTDSEGNRRTATTGSFGIYTFTDVAAGQSYAVGVAAKRYRFTSRIVNVTDSLTDVNFVGQE